MCTSCRAVLAWLIGAVVLGGCACPPLDGDGGLAAVSLFQRPAEYAAWQPDQGLRSAILGALGLVPEQVEVSEIHKHGKDIYSVWIISTDPNNPYGYIVQLAGRQDCLEIVQTVPWVG